MATHEETLKQHGWEQPANQEYWSHPDHPAERIELVEGGGWKHKVGSALKGHSRYKIALADHLPRYRAAQQEAV